MPVSKLTTAATRAIDEYWSASFACAVDALRPARAVVVPFAAHNPYNGVYAMSFGAEPIISVPGSRVDELTPLLRSWTSHTLHHPERALASLGEPAQTVIGPAWVGYADAGTFHADALRQRARLLDADDAPAVETLRQSCPVHEWDHGGTQQIGDNTVAGSFADDVLVALAGYEMWGDRLAHLSVVTHPAHRGLGHGRSAVALIARHALEQGHVLQYRALESNTASRRVADALGFEHWATSLAIRFR
jgi:GNAT superfamily N-acetyltransferase